MADLRPGESSLMLLLTFVFIGFGEAFVLTLVLNVVTLQPGPTLVWQIGSRSVFQTFEVYQHQYFHVVEYYQIPV